MKEPIHPAKLLVPPPPRRLPRPAWLDHPHLRGSYHYVLPTRLLDEVLPHLSPSGLDQELIELDRAIARTADHAPQLIGFHRGTAVHHELVRCRTPLPHFGADASDLQRLADLGGKTVAQVELTLAQAAPDVGSVQMARRAYCGWLTTNRQFLAEHDALWTRWGPSLASSLPAMGPTVDRPQSVGGAQHAQGPQAEALADLERFLRHWELAQLAGPRLPVPPPQQWPVLLRPPGHLDDDEAVRSFQVARVLPLPGAERMRQMTEASLGRDRVGGHLREWMSVVRKGNTAKHALHRWARLFELQHFWRLLHGRYAVACERRKERLVPAFARYLGVADETVHADLRLINRLLGSGWYRSPRPE